jgi:hypothetical protein
LYSLIATDRIGGVMISVLASSAVDRGIEPLSGQTKDYKIGNVQWDDDVVCFVLDQHAALDFYSASSLKQQSADKHVAPLGHIILIPSQPVFVLTS